MSLKTPKNYTLISEIETTHLICPYNADATDDGGVKASVKLAYLAAQVKLVVMQECLNVMRRITEVVYDPNAATYEDGEPKQKLQEYKVSIAVGEDASSYSSKIIAQTEQGVELAAHHSVDNERATAIFDEVASNIHEKLVVLFQANGIAALEPPTVPLEQAQVLVNAQRAARKVQTAAESLASLRRAREHYIEYAATMREEIAKASDADLKRLAELGVDFAAVEKHLEVEVGLVAEALGCGCEEDGIEAE